MAMALHNIHGSRVCFPGKHVELSGTGLDTRDTTMNKAGEIYILLLGGGLRQ
jgi:hypothetical protein